MAYKLIYIYVVVLYVMSGKCISVAIILSGSVNNSYSLCYL